MSTSSTKGGRAASDNGSALIMVMVGMTVLAMFATVALTYSAQTLKATRHSQDLITSLAAAQGGADEYLARLNQNDAYWQKTLDCANPAMSKPMPVSTAYTCTPSTPFGWGFLPGVDTASFHYDVDTRSTPVNGIIVLTVTGRANNLNRTIQVGLRRAGFGEFLYYTDYETIDPGNEVEYPNTDIAYDKCAHYFWELPPAPSKARDINYCADIQFTTGDVLKGPIHSNDAILMNGSPWFKGNVSTSRPKCRPTNGVAPPVTDCYRVTTSTANPIFDKGITYKDLIDLPSSIGSQLQYVDPAKTTTPGCLYTGPTRIKILAPTGADVLSKMQVWSPYSTTTLNPGCGNPTAHWPQTMTIPNNNIIVIQDIPDGQSRTNTGSCDPGEIGDGLPQAGDINRTLNEANCRYGNAYIEGRLAGKLSISADNNIIITGNLEYNGGKTGTDVLGLIATNSVKLYHPVSVSCDSYWWGKCVGYGGYDNMLRPNGSTFSNPVIQAAILTLQHSITVQYYQYGSALGTLHLFGSFAQRYRGPVGTSGSGGTGYLKDYEYDTRLRYAPPPYFLDPIHASWGVKTFGELAAR